MFQVKHSKWNIVFALSNITVFIACLSIHIICSMKSFVYLFSFFLSIPLLAQTNYVANTGNTIVPGNYTTLVAGYANTVSGNTFVGSQAGFRNQTGSENTFVGYQAGVNRNHGQQQHYWA